MLKKLLTVLLGAVLSFQVAALTKDECREAAENLFAAQNILNVNPTLFKETHEGILADKPESYGWSPELYEFITKLASKLKPGNDPQKVGKAVFEGCVAKLEAV